MKRFTQTLSVIVVLSLSLAAVARRRKPAAAKSVATTAAVSSGSLPSEGTLSAFLKQMFGWNRDLTWKIADIKPSEASGLSEVTVVFSTPQGQPVIRLYITADQKFTFTGDLVPFGVDPFAAARADLRNLTGPAHGPQDAAVTMVEFGDFECPACKAAQPNITKLMAEEPKMRLMFQNFPLEQIHKWSLRAAKYLDCMQRELTMRYGSSSPPYMTTRAKSTSRTPIRC